MFKPVTTQSASLDAQVADLTPSRYNLGPDATWKPAPVPFATVPLHDSSRPESQEDTLVDIHSILQSAAATAYEHADNQTGSNRKLAMGVVHLIELAQLKMDSVLDKQSANAVC